ncbi:MAG TPA: histidine--tRNA ligase [Thermoplasmata archaeon]|nr:histidine--tRNA ligase [Thermoplasmata archaeon]HUJ77697.1 histidine--tRNA ligase [Thermoplasmata archaeon]
MPFEALRGFRDYPAPDAGARSELRRRMRSVARRCGFVEVETPSLESLELLKAKSGDEIVRQLFEFTDKGGRAVALTPESTPSVARMFIDRAKAEPMPAKWFTVARLWRYEEPQSGRTREFSQFNLDVFGVPGPAAEVELLATASLLLDEIGAQGLYGFRINDRALAEGLGRGLGVTDPARYFRALDRFEKAPRAESERELAAAGVDPEGIDRLGALIAAASDPAGDPAAVLEAIGARAVGPEAAEGRARLETILRLAGRAGLGDRLRLDPSLVRGLAYYTSTVFEAFDRAGDLRSLFGGGRYDRLVETLGGPPTPACGLAVGDQTLELLLRQGGRWPDGEPPLDTYVVAVTEAEAPEATEWVQRLRRAGVSADGDLLGRSLSRQLKEAARRKARRALILGPRERAKGTVVERDLTTGAQTERPSSEVLPPA